MCIAQQQYLPSSNAVPCRAISSSWYHQLRPEMFKTLSITRPKRIITGNVESLIGVSFAVGARRCGRPSPDGAARSFYSTAPVNPIPTANSTSNPLRGCYPSVVGCFSLSASNIIPVHHCFHTTTPSRFSIRSNSFSKMAATKDYRLLCLENPLLGESSYLPYEPFLISLRLNWQRLNWQRLSNFWAIRALFHILGSPRSSMAQLFPSSRSKAARYW